MVRPDGLILTVRVTPKGGRDAVGGVDMLDDGRSVLTVRVRAAPANGEATAAVVTLVARALAVAPRDVSLVAGATARIKRLRIAGDGVQLATRLEALAGATG